MDALRVNFLICSTKYIPITEVTIHLTVLLVMVISISAFSQSPATCIAHSLHGGLSRRCEVSVPVNGFF